MLQLRKWFDVACCHNLSIPSRMLPHPNDNSIMKTVIVLSIPSRMLPVSTITKS